jgi:hypothetical protein
MIWRDYSWGGMGVGDALHLAIAANYRVAAVYSFRWRRGGYLDCRCVWGLGKSETQMNAYRRSCTQMFLFY